MRRPASAEERNQRSVLIDGLGVGITAGIGTFLSVFLVRLGASDFMVGLLTAMPALTGMFLAIPVGQFLARQRNIVPWFARSRFLVLSCYLLTGLVPFLFQSRRPEVIIAVWALATLPQTVVAVSFTVVMGAVAGPRGRITLMSRRWSTLGLVSALTVFGAGQVLRWLDFPLNYQVIFIASAVGALISVIFSSSIRLPEREAPTPGSVRGSFATFLEQFSTLRRHRSFTNFLAAQFVFRFGMALAVPLFPIYWVRNAQATDPQISLINAANTLVMMLGYFLWTNISRKRGERRVLLITAAAVSFYPLLTALTHSPWALVAWAGLAGLFVGGIDLVFFDVVLATCPEENQAAYVGIYHTTVYVATFLAPLLGTTLSVGVGIVPALILAAALRFLGFGLLARLGVGRNLSPA